MGNEINQSPIIFVGGAPRSGTTVCHALMCTSQRINAYHSEISYVTPIVRAYATGLDAWNRHTRSFFAEKEHFRLHMKSLLSMTFEHIRMALGSPEILCVKDPLLTPYFPKLHELFGNQVKFITVIRHPYRILRSREEVAANQNKDFNRSDAYEILHQFNQSYQHLSNPAFGQGLYSFRYEDMLSQKVLSDIRSFSCCDDISPDNVWNERREKLAEPRERSESATIDPWYSPKYHGSIDLTDRLGPLRHELRVIADEVCGPMMAQYGYEKNTP